MSNAFRPFGLAALALAAATALPGPSEAAPRPSITVELTADDGSRIPGIDVSDLSVALARTLPGPKTGSDVDSAGKDDTMDQASLTLDTSVLSNPALINWIGQGGANASATVKVTGGGQATTYVLSGISTWSLSVSHSSSGGDGQVSLSLAAKHMTINGITAN